MLYKIIFLAILVGLVALLVFDALPSNTEYASCYSKMRSNVSRIERIAREREWDNPRLCKTKNAQILNDSVCIENVSKAHITAPYVLLVSSNRTNINNLLLDFNKDCFDYEAPLYGLGVLEEEKSQ